MLRNTPAYQDFSHQKTGMTLCLLMVHTMSLRSYSLQRVSKVENHVHGTQSLQFSQKLMCAKLTLVEQGHFQQFHLQYLLHVTCLHFEVKFAEIKHTKIVLFKCEISYVIRKTIA